MIRALGIGLAALALGAPLLAQSGEAPAAAPAPAPTVTQMRTAEGKDVGTVTFTQTDHGVLIAVKVQGISPGKHGLHIHQTGACTPDFMAAGGHFNPGNAEHGFHAPGGYHVGDLPNLDVAADGTATAEFFVPGVTIKGEVGGHLRHTLSDQDGSSMMIHAATDDYKTMASSGGRFACGVIAAKK